MRKNIKDRVKKPLAKVNEFRLLQLSELPLNKRVEEWVHIGRHKCSSPVHLESHGAQIRFAFVREISQPMGRLRELRNFCVFQAQ